MLASIQGAGVTLPNLAFTLIMKSVQQLPSVPKAPTEQNKPQTTPLADSQRHIDVKA